MPRSKWKGYFVEINFLKKIKNKKIKNFTKSRNSVILPEFIGHNFSVYNGKLYKDVFITSEMIGKKLGEFSYTRFLKKNIHIKKSNKKK